MASREPSADSRREPYITEVIAFLRERATKLNEMAVEWEHIEYNHAYDYWDRSAAFESAADMLEGERRVPSRHPNEEERSRVES